MNPGEGQRQGVSGSMSYKRTKLMKARLASDQKVEKKGG